MQYDRTGLLYSVPGLINSTSYNGRDQALSVAYANGVTSAYGYNDARGWVSTITHSNGAGTLMGLTYAWHINGHLQSVTSSTDATGSWVYGYDNLYRVSAATNQGNAALTQGFAYDNAGSLTAITGNGAVSLTYPAATSPHPHAPLTAGARAFTYDANGNTLTDGLRTFTYDGENRPSNVVFGANTVAYVYGRL